MDIMRNCTKYSTKKWQKQSRTFMKSRIPYIVVIIICLTIISIGTYYVLGGFDKTEVYFFEGTERTVIGKEHFIPDDRKSFEMVMDSAKADLLKGLLKGKLTAVIFQDEWQERDSIHCFIGTAQDSIKGVVRLPVDYEYQKFSTNRIYKIFVTQSMWVVPSPEKIEEIMGVKSIEEGEVLQPITFELYYEDGSFSVEKWVK